LILISGLMSLLTSKFQKLQILKKQVIEVTK